MASNTSDKRGTAVLSYSKNKSVVAIVNLLDNLSVSKCITKITREKNAYRERCQLNAHLSFYSINSDGDHPSVKLFICPSHN